MYLEATCWEMRHRVASITSDLRAMRVQSSHMVNMPPPPPSRPPVHPGTQGPSCAAPRAGNALTVALLERCDIHTMYFRPPCSAWECTWTWHLFCGAHVTLTQYAVLKYEGATMI